MCVLAGITTLLQGANIGMKVCVHQFTIVGHYSMIGMGSSLVKNVRPFTIYVTNKPPRVNLYAIEKFGLQEYTDEISAYVIDGKKCTSDKVLAYVEEFEKLHIESKRPLYTS